MFIIKCKNIILQCSAVHFHKKICDLDPIYEWQMVEFRVRSLTTAIHTKGLIKEWVPRHWGNTVRSTKK